MKQSVAQFPEFCRSDAERLEIRIGIHPCDEHVGFSLPKLDVGQGVDGAQEQLHRANVQLRVEGYLDRLEIVIVDELRKLKATTLRVLYYPIIHPDALGHIFPEIYAWIAKLAFERHLRDTVHHRRNDAERLFACPENLVNL